jgi:hypothetical protein
VARIGGERKLCRVWWESPKERDLSEDQGVGGRKESKWISGKLSCGGEWIKDQ